MLKILFLFFFASFGMFLGAGETISWDLSKYRNDGKNGAIQMEKKDSGLKIAVSRKEKFWGGIYFDAPGGHLNAAEYNTFLIRIRPENSEAEERMNKISCAVYGKKGWGVRTLEFQKQPDDTFVARWDVVNKPPTGNYGFDPADLIRIRLAFPHGMIPEKKVLNYVLLGMESVSGMEEKTGDPVLYSRWKNEMKDYRADVSTDPSLLEPPQKGRLSIPFFLVKNGKAEGEIVLPPNPTPAEKYAANELRHWIREIAGGELPVVSVPTGKPSVCLETLPGDRIHGAWKIRSGKNCIVISGIGDRGVIAGAAVFLENNSDIIFARPNREFGTVFTKTTDFPVRWGDGSFSPKGKFFGWLNNWGGGAGWILPWIARNGGNYKGTGGGELGFRTEFGGGHNLQSFIPPKNPAFYPVVNGKKPESLSIWKHQICMSAPDLVRVYAENVRKYYETKAPAGTDVMNIKIEDNWGVCECAGCTAPIRLENGSLLRKDHPAFRSTQFFLFLNGVAKTLKKTHPDLQIQTYAYFFTAVPPLCKLDPNLWVLFCPYPRNDYKTPLCSPFNEVWWKRFTDWSHATSNIILREYYGILNDGRPLAEVAAFDMKCYFEKGVRSMAPELSTDGTVLSGFGGPVRGSQNEWDLNMMEYWVLNRLYLDPGQDVAALRKYFIERTFHGAAPVMAKFYGILRETHYLKLRGVSSWGDFGTLVRSSGKVAELKACLDEAVRSAGHPVSAHLAARIRAAFENALQKKRADAGSTAEDMFYYGWSAEGEKSEIYGTTVWNGESLKKAVRFVIRRSNPNYQLRVPLPKDAAGKTLCFRLTPGKNFGNIRSLGAVVSGDGWKTQKAPDSVWKDNGDGTFEFCWTFGDSLTFEKIARFHLTYPSDRIPEGEDVEFLLTGIQLK